MIVAKMTAAEIRDYAKPRGLTALEALAEAAVIDGRHEALAGLREYAAYCIAPNFPRAEPWSVDTVFGDEPTKREPVAWQRRFIGSDEGPSRWIDCPKGDLEFYQRHPDYEIRGLVPIADEPEAETAVATREAAP